MTTNEIKRIIIIGAGQAGGETAQRLRQAGFEMARTIEQGYVTVGSDKLALPCIRVNFGMCVPEVKKLIG